MHSCMYMYACMHVYVYACMNVCMCACMHEHTHLSMSIIYLYLYSDIRSHLHTYMHRPHGLGSPQAGKGAMGRPGRAGP